ncbi:MAG TPA: peptidylprolyl isomerase [Bacteroidota bacterium]
MNRTTLQLTVFGLVLLAGCAGSVQDTQTQSPAVAVFGSDRITVKDFEEAYAKNNGGWEKGVAASLEERERFLELLVKFKLKVREARDRGLERDSSVRQELESYGLSIATSYMLEKELVEPNVKKSFVLKKDEVRASHILILLNPEPTPEDTATAYAKAVALIEQALTTPFDSLAVRHSEDPSAATNRGDLGYFSGGRMVPEFEDAAFRMQAGEYSRMPVRTQFGYHIIKVTDRRPAAGSIRLSHILRRFSDTLQDTSAVQDSVWAIYKLITGGLEFSKAAQQYSQDPGSSARGGDLGFFERARLPEQIAVQFYDKPIGTVFEPMLFPYGYHIFLTTEKKTAPGFAELERDLRTQYQSTRYPADYSLYLHGLKKKHQFTLDIPTMYEFSHAFDTTTSPARAGWSDTLSARLLQRQLIALADVMYRVRDVVEFINTSGEFKNSLLTTTNIETIVERFTEIKVLEYEAKNIPQRHPEFDKLMKEYEDGILLFKIEQDEVWSTIDGSDSTLRAYYESNKEEYRIPNRVTVQEILVKSDSLANALYKRLRAGEDFGGLASEYSVRVGIKEKKGLWESLAPETHAVTEKGWAMQVDSISAPFQLSEGWSIVKVVAKQTSRLKNFEEVLTELINSYREYASTRREKEWVNELKKKYGVVMTKELLTGAFQRKPGDTP